MNWITRGNDASVIQYAITTVAGIAGAPNVGVGVGAGYFPVADMRSVLPGDAADAMLGWSYKGTIFGAAYGGRVSLTGSIGMTGNPLHPRKISWVTGGGSVGFGTPGVGVYGGTSYSFPSFGHSNTTFTP
ncbi:hypothetical protein Q766_21120 [Flavobacterium subsaxonicum WB 4.1-42 = DSM 21790]|uniref:Uncharacterized protein n=1 Tax=Flavobacterium subsaxonicum WB 4.1-42 = DSM 21790 TaxID=1121898 RepID=A0A0A2MQK3_9FLAO|nr:hypothetical protein Q766_21120 [Flavobacterium subsaxonicum WB 4.1-42 = DSM 21790]